MRTILIWFQSGGPFMVPLLLVALAGLTVLVERTNYIVLRSKINARPFIERVLSLVRAGKIDDALKLCAEHQSALPDLGLIMLRSRTRQETDLKQIAHASSLTVIPGLMRRLPWLSTLATIAVLLGVLGATVNLHEALTRAAATNTQGALLSGVTYALRPFGAGLLIAIPLVLGHAYLLSEAKGIAAQIEEFSARLMNALVDRPDVRLGHR